MMGPISFLLLTLTIQVTVFAIVIGAIQKFAMGKSPKAAARLIAFGMLLLLGITAAVMIPFPSWFDLLGADRPHVMTSNFDDEELLSLSSFPAMDASEFLDGSFSEDPIASPVTSSWAETFMSMASQFVGRSVGASGFSNSMTWNGVVCFGICFLGLCVFGFGRLVFGLLALRRLRLGSKAVSSDGTIAMLRQLCQKIGCDREIEVLQTPQVGTAATMGFWKPRIFLAGDFDSWKRAEQESVLAHEIAHIHHGDFAANIISQICASMHFFNPAVHWLVGQMRLNQEVAADQIASQATSGSVEYARTLAVLALRQDNQNQLRLASMFIPNQNSFVRRIKMLKHVKRNSSATVGWKAILATMIVAFAISGIRAPESTAEQSYDNGGSGGAVGTLQQLDGETGTEAKDQSFDDQSTGAQIGESTAQKPVALASELIYKLRTDGFDESRYTQALSHLRSAIDADPDNVSAKTSLADLYILRANAINTGTEPYIESLKLAQKELESVTAVEHFYLMQHVLAVPQLVDVCVKLGDGAKARQVFADASTKIMRIAKSSPEIYETWSSLVQCAVSVKDYKRANKIIRTAYQTVKSIETRQRLVQLASLIHIQNADDFSDTSTEENFRKRLFALCNAISSSPRDVKIYKRLIEYIDVDLDSERRDVWLRNSILDCPTPGIVHILIGTREIIRGDIVAGKTSWDIAQHQLGTTDYVVHRLLSVAMKDDPECGKGDLLDTAILQFPNQYMLYETRGAFKKGEQKFDEAIDDFKNVVEKVPGLIIGHKHLSDCYGKIGDSKKMAIHADRVQEILASLDEEKRELYKRMLDSLNTGADARAAVALNQLGNEALIRRQFAEAIRYYEWAREKSPKDPSLLNNLAFTYITAGDEDRDAERALQLVDEAITNLPTNIEPKSKAQFLHTKATILKQLDRLQEAIALYERALKSRPDHVDSLSSVIDCYRALRLQVPDLQVPKRYIERLEELEQEQQQTDK